MKQTSINRIFKKTTLYSVQKSDLKRCAELMANAFSTDPSIRHLLGGAERGENDWRYFYTVLKSVFGKSVMLSCDSKLNELLVLFPPKLKAVPTFSFFINGGRKLSALFGKGLLVRSMRYEANCKRIKKQIISKDTWYCMCFVVSPELQGQGRGSRLIKSALKELDKHNISLYLETHKAVNVEIYKHLGFELRSSTYIPKTKIKQYGMLRNKNEMMPP